MFGETSPLIELNLFVFLQKASKKIIDLTL